MAIINESPLDIEWKNIYDTVISKGFDKFTNSKIYHEINKGLKITDKLCNPEITYTYKINRTPFGIAYCRTSLKKHSMNESKGELLNPKTFAIQDFKKTKAEQVHYYENYTACLYDVLYNMIAHRKKMAVKLSVISDAKEFLSQANARKPIHKIITDTLCCTITDKELNSYESCCKTRAKGSKNNFTSSNDRVDKKTYSEKQDTYDKAIWSAHSKLVELESQNYFTTDGGFSNILKIQEYVNKIVEKHEKK